MRDEIINSDVKDEGRRKMKHFATNYKLIMVANQSRAAIKVNFTSTHGEKR